MSKKIGMRSMILSDAWEKGAPARQKSLQEMNRHPMTWDELMEQKRRNELIRQENMLGNKQLK